MEFSRDCMLANYLDIIDPMFIMHSVFPPTFVWFCSLCPLHSDESKEKFICA
jgi:hypothetical protein